MRVEVAGKKSNSADEIVARLVDYGPISMSLVLLAAFVTFLPYQEQVRWGLPFGIGLFLVVYHYMVARDVRPTVPTSSISGLWFLAGLSAGFLGTLAPWFVSVINPLQPLAGHEWIGWIPLQIATGLFGFLVVQGIRQRHSLLISMIGILMTSWIVVLWHWLRLHPEFVPG